MQPCRPHITHPHSDRTRRGRFKDPPPRFAWCLGSVLVLGSTPTPQSPCPLAPCLSQSAEDTWDTPVQRLPPWTPNIPRVGGIESLSDGRTITQPDSTACQRALDIRPTRRGRSRRSRDHDDARRTRSHRGSTIASPFMEEGEVAVLHTSSRQTESASKCWTTGFHAKYFACRVFLGWTNSTVERPYFGPPTQNSPTQPPER